MFLAGLVGGGEGWAAVRLPKLVGDRMVLQRETELKIWGWADPGEKVTVRFRDTPYYTEADGTGKWHVMLPPQQPGGPFLMEVNEKVIRDVLVGDVYLCGGQSNQETPIERLVEKFPEIPVSNNHMIRHYKVPSQDVTDGVREEIAGDAVWHSATASEVMNWTSLAYFFATEVWNRYHVPVGMLVASKGGTDIESWISQERLKDFPRLLVDEEAVRKVKESRQDKGSGRWNQKDFDDSDWAETEVPGTWDERGIRTKGSVWYRKTFDLPSSMVGRHARIYMGRMADGDSVFVNGRLVGTTSYFGPPRKYDIPAGVLVQGKNIGVKVTGVEVDFPQVIAHKNDISKKLTGGVRSLLKMNKVTVIDGKAAFTAPKKLSVKKADGSHEEMTADAIIISTGSVNSTPPIPGLKENPNCIDSTGALSLKVLPKSMVVIGGGVIGLELACAYAAFGTKITVVEAMDHMLPMLDGDLTKIGVEHMKKMGMEFHLECPVQAVESSSVGAKVICKNKAGETVSFEAEKVLVAIGRKANTAMLDLDAGKLDNDRGRIKVNDKMETSVPGVYAIGDCVMGYAQLAHTASAMGEVAAENVCGHEVHYDESTNPTCVYIEPEAASVGLTEEQCKAKGIAYKVGKFPMSANGKALILNGGEGLVKLIAGAKYGEILGMHIIGPRATDLISEGALAIRLEATVDELISTIHSHPTVTETLREAALNVEKRAIHTPNR